MLVGELLCRIEEHGVTLRCELSADRLHYSPPGALPPDLLDQLKASKEEVIRILREDDVFERTGIIQAEGDSQAADDNAGAQRQETRGQIREWRVTKGVGELVSDVYAAGARLMVLDGRLAVDGAIPDEFREKVRAHRDELLEALVGDPLEGFGWEARTALYRSALQWLDEEIEKMGLESTSRTRAAIDALCSQDVADSLNAAWCGGDFQEFRAALREYVRAGLHAARSKIRVEDQETGGDDRRGLAKPRRSSRRLVGRG